MRQFNFDLFGHQSAGDPRKRLVASIREIRRLEAALGADRDALLRRQLSSLQWGMSVVEYTDLLNRLVKARRPGEGFNVLDGLWG